MDDFAHCFFDSSVLSHEGKWRVFFAWISYGDLTIDCVYSPGRGNSHSSNDSKLCRMDGFTVRKA